MNGRFMVDGRYTKVSLYFFSAFLLLNGFSAYVVSADVDTTQAEISHLLGYIGHSECEFIRNGKSYDSEEGLKHINKKYKHFKNKIKTAEDFVKRSATGSLISGKPYFVICAGMATQKKSADWLHEELIRFRAISLRKDDQTRDDREG